MVYYTKTAIALFFLVQLLACGKSSETNHDFEKEHELVLYRFASMGWRVSEVDGFRNFDKYREVEGYVDSKCFKVIKGDFVLIACGTRCSPEAGCAKIHEFAYHNRPWFDGKYLSDSKLNLSYLTEFWMETTSEKFATDAAKLDSIIEEYGRITPIMFERHYEIWKDTVQKYVGIPI